MATVEARLLAALIEDVTARGFRRMIAVIGDHTNTVSIHLHEAAGFAPGGVYPAIAYKHGRWLTSVHLQRTLGPGDTTAPV
ncbi:MAG: hypothetical protein HC794_06450 [Nitrospiraceae bacterium]|nr:hypothetical protein [Nitrospiraceae bacterium]